MILIVDLTNPAVPLLRSEFIDPIYRIVQGLDHPVRVAGMDDVISCDPDISGIIMSGTALADTWYRSRYHMPTLCPCPVLGICAGMQILLTESGGSLVPALEIGMIPVHMTDDGQEDPLTRGKNDFSAYVLHQFSASLPESWLTLAMSDSGPQIVRAPDRYWYGVLFHPEVRNEWVIERFVKLCSLFATENDRRGYS